MCKRIYKEQTSEQGDVPFFKIGTFGADPDAFISNELFEDFKRTYPYPTPGTLLISAAGSIGRIVEYQGEKAYFQDSNIVWLEHDHRLNDAFLKPLYSQIEWGLEGSTIKRLYNKDLLSAEVTIPDGKEQKEIGQFFAKLDSLITLHQCKCQHCSLCGYLSWEQRKFSELYVVNNERNESCEFGYDKTLSVATMTYNGGNGAADNSLSTYKVVRVGDIAFEGHTNKEHAYGRFVLNDAGDGLMSPRFSCLRPIVEQRYSFWKHYIPRESMMRPVLVNATKSGTMMNELVPADLMRESILVPVLYEQEAIGRFFKQLDDLITLHQREPPHMMKEGKNANQY